MLGAFAGIVTLYPPSFMSRHLLWVVLITFAVTVQGALALHVRVAGQGCFPVPLGQVTGQEAWSVRIAKLSTDLCSHDQYRHVLHGAAALSFGSQALAIM